VSVPATADATARAICQAAVGENCPSPRHPCAEMLWSRLFDRLLCYADDVAGSGPVVLHADLPVVGAMVPREPPLARGRGPAAPLSAWALVSACKGTIWNTSDGRAALVPGGHTLYPPDNTGRVQGDDAASDRGVHRHGRGLRRTGQRMRAESVVRELLAQAGVEVDGSRPFDIQVNDRRFYPRVLAEASLGFGESYMDGWWDCAALDQLLDRILRAGLEQKIPGDWRIGWHLLRSRLFNLQKRSRAGTVARRHYDLGNDFYRAMLGRSMQYTCAYWQDAAELDEAQEAKLDLVCRKVGLRPGMNVLELGCGWGGFARWAAEKYGVRVTAYNVSREQVQFAREACAGLPVEIVHDDYRNASGTYDAVVSVGIMEHVGYKNYRTYMELAHRCLAEDGVTFVHTIGGNVSTTTSNPWTTKYIFPNGMLPSIAQLSAAMEGLFVVEDWHNFGPDYDRTLMAWHHNFLAAWPTFAERYGERFRRMWDFYLLGSAAGFRARSTQLWQIVMTREGRRQPPRVAG
jgi:cyclopropane-fatty-acyl-phospholipid synthase